MRQIGVSPALEVDHLIVGAGVTGLSVANFLTSSSYLICEATQTTGGYCQTIHSDGFVWDYAGHFLHFRHKEMRDYVLSKMGANNLMQTQKVCKIYYRGALIDYPFQSNLHQLPENAPPHTAAVEASQECIQANNLQEFLIAHYGAPSAHKFLIPYNQKVYATDLRRLHPNINGRFMPSPPDPQNRTSTPLKEDTSYNSIYYCCPEGAVELIRALERSVPGARIALNEPVLRIDLHRKSAVTPRRAIRFRTLINSAPFDRLLCLAGVPHDPTRYTSSKVLVFNLGFDRKGIHGVHWIYFPQSDITFYRVGFYNNIMKDDRMSLYVEVALPATTAVADSDVPKWKKRVEHDLRTVGILTDQRLVAAHHVILDPAYVHITPATVAEVARLKTYLSGHGVYSIGRYGSWSYSSIEDNMVEAQSLARELNRSSSGKGCTTSS